MNNLGKTQYDVDILCATYNQCQYLNKALESFIQQKTKYSFRIIICDDCSTDGTNALCKKYKEEYPDIIHYVRNKVNIGLIENYVNGIKLCNSRYIAYCDGDDFWTDPLKLEKQISYMENNPEVILTHHKDCLLFERAIDYKVYSDVIQHPNLFQVYDQHFISAPSIVCRNFFNEEHYPIMLKAGSGDIAIFAMAAVFGRIDFLGDEMACYRLTIGAETSKFHRNLKREIDNLNYILTLNKVYKVGFGKQLSVKAESVLKKNASHIKHLTSITQLKIKAKNIFILSPNLSFQIMFKYFFSF